MRDLRKGKAATGLPPDARPLEITRQHNSMHISMPQDDLRGKQGNPMTTAQRQAWLWRVCKSIALDGLRRGGDRGAIQALSAWWAMQGGQRGSLHALDAYQIGRDAGRFAIGEACHDD